MREITLTAEPKNTDQVIDFVDAQLADINCSVKIRRQIDIAIDELFSNVANYAYAPETGSATVRVEVEDDPLAVIITFMDGGIPYDPLKKADPDTTLSADERSIGGLGVFLVKQYMDDISYEYRDGKNILRIKKDI